VTTGAPGPLPLWALQRLEGERVARLATADAAGVPSVVPVCFVWHEGSVYTAIDGKPKASRRLRRLRNLEQNPHATLLLDGWSEDWSRLWWVLVRGSATVATAGAEAALRRLERKYEQYAEVAAGPEVIRLEPAEIRSWRAADAS
jgi:PPOX class probable F420-dependent enzyme